MVNLLKNHLASETATMTYQRSLNFMNTGKTSPPSGFSPTPICTTQMKPRTDGKRGKSRKTTRKRDRPKRLHTLRSLEI